MVITEKIYKEGFLDGMRYSGGLLADVPDSDLILNHSCLTAIYQNFKERRYFDGEGSDLEKMHSFFRRAITDANEAWDRVRELEELLLIANREKEMRLNKEYEFDGK